MDGLFFILESDPVVRLDVEGMLRAQYPGCNVFAGSSLADIGAAFDDSGQDSTLFVKSALISGADAALRAAAERGCRIVILGESVGHGFPATSVHLPFNEEMLLAAISDRTSLNGSAEVRR